MLNFNEREFEEMVINGNDWNGICDFESNDPSLSFQNFYQRVNFHLDEMAPYKKMTIKELKLAQKPWITKEILSKCTQRDSLLSQIKREKDQNKIEILRNQYKTLRNQITKDKRVSKKQYYFDYFKANRKKSSEIWKGIKALVNLKSSTKSSIQLFDKSKNIVNDPSVVSNIFNDYFSDLGRNVQRKIPEERGSFTKYLNKKDKNGRAFINPDGFTFF